MDSRWLFFAILFAPLACFCTDLPAQYSILDSHDISEISTGNSLLDIFQKWKIKHRKVYEHEEEEAKRLTIFGQNLKFVLERHTNSKTSGSGNQVGLNKFADLTNDEFRHRYLAKIKPRIKRADDTQQRRAFLHTCQAPSSLDWRNHGVVTGVKDQGQCGSCWAFSSTGAIESVNAINTGNLVSLSEQELVDCDATNEGCNGGYMDYAFEWVINNQGIDSESDYPYTSGNSGNDGVCNTTKEESKVVTIDGYYDVDQSDSALLCAVAQQPISVGIDASSMSFQLYTGGVYSGPCSSDPNNIDHAVLIVGYGSSSSGDYWIVKNSWGTSWGVNGYFNLNRTSSSVYGTCGVNAMASYPTQTGVSPSPTPPPSPPSPTPPSPSPTPPPPPSPTPSTCGDNSYCSTNETCCCLLEMFNFCFVYGCCPYENAVCCAGTEYCCPSDYPVCDTGKGLCLQNKGDKVGINASRRRMAKHKAPWSKSEERREIVRDLKWRRNQIGSMR